MEEKMNEKRSDMMGKVALGATGLAVATGVIVTGVVLATNEKARKAVTKGAMELIKGTRSVLMQGMEKYQTVSHRISVGGKRKRGGKATGLELARKRLGRH